MDHDEYKQILIEDHLGEFFRGKPKGKFRGDELYYGIEFSLKEFIKFLGGESRYKNILKILKSIIDDDIKESKKKGYPIPKPPIKYIPDDYATVSTPGDTGKLYIQYRINAEDSTGHSMAAAWQIDFKIIKQYGTDASGWDG